MPTNIRIQTYVTKMITPVVLIAGLLLLALYHFHGVLKITQTQNAQFHGVATFSSGNLALSFQENSGIDRPQVLYDNRELLTYADWSSQLTVDGNVIELWNNNHGYSIDTAKHQVFSTTTGNGWQVTQIVTLVNASTITVNYDFTARSGAGDNLQTVTLNMMHVGDGYWYSPTIQGNIFTAQALPIVVSNVQNAQTNGATPVNPLGTLRVKESGKYVAHQTPVASQSVVTFPNGSGGQERWANSFTTQYSITHPQVDRLIPLGSETITFTPASRNASQPINVPVPAGS